MIKRLKWGLYDFLWHVTIGIANLGLLGSATKQWLNTDRQTHVPTTFRPESVVLFMCASAGEYNRIEALALKLLERGKSVEIVFYSPSGMNYAESIDVQIPFAFAPLDINSKVNNFMEEREIELVIVSSNLIWPNFLRNLIENRIPYAYVGCDFVGDTWDSRFYLNRMKYFLQNAIYLFPISEKSNSFLYQRGIQNVTTIKDPRLEQISRADQTTLYSSKLEKWKGSSKLVILGSAYLKEVSLLTEVYDLLKNLNYKILIVPHELSHIHSIEVALNKSEIEYYISSNIDNQCAVVILDKVGVLKHLYQYADFTLVGGGWNKGIHNVLEAAIEDTAILIGPNYNNSREAIALVEMKYIQVVHNSEDLSMAIESITAGKFNREIISKKDNYLQLDRLPSDVIIKILEL